MDIEEELDKKSIERDTDISELEPEPEPEPDPVVEPVKKTKKKRSPAQIAAFEKARLARLEKVKIRKQNEKEQNKPIEEVAEVGPEVDTPPLKKLVRQNSVRDEPIKKQEQAIQNHYYYYGVPPPTKPNRKKKTKTKKQLIPVSSSSEEEESESEEESEEETVRPPSPIQQPDIYKELQNYEIKVPRQSKKTLYKFGYA